MPYNQNYISDSAEPFLFQPLICGTVFHRTSLLPPLSPSSTVLLNHISSHFLISLSDSSLICTVPAQWLVILDSIIDVTFNFYVVHWCLYHFFCVCVSVTLLWNSLTSNLKSRNCSQATRRQCWVLHFTPMKSLLWVHTDMVYPPTDGIMVTHPSTNLAQCRLTTLIKLSGRALCRHLAVQRWTWHSTSLPHQTLRMLFWHTHSSSYGDFCVPRTNLRLSDKASVAGPWAWNFTD